MKKLTLTKMSNELKNKPSNYFFYNFASFLPDYMMTLLSQFVMKMLENIYELTLVIKILLNWNNEHTQKGNVAQIIMCFSV